MFLLSQGRHVTALASESFVQEMKEGIQAMLGNYKICRKASVVYVASDHNYRNIPEEQK